MWIRSLYELEKENFFVSDISSLYRAPSYRTLEVDSRPCNGFLLIEQGQGKYTWEGGSANIIPGTLLYLPAGSRHKLQVFTDDFAFSRVDFTITDANHENILFSQTPIRICKHQNRLISDIFSRFNDLFGDAGSNFKRLALLFELFDVIKKLSDLGERNNILAVISYIESHYTEEIDCSTLADICCTSTAQMYRLFKKETNETPISFKNKLRIDRAKTMLLDPSFPVGDISAVLGFENVYYFSRLFKNLTGISPSQFRTLSLKP